MQTLFIRGDIRTMNAAMPRAEAMIVENGRIAFVGNESSAAAWLGGRAHDLLDAHGRTVLPGFNDTHLHFAHLSLQAQRTSLHSARSVQEIVTRLREGLAANTTGGWLIGEGWNQETFADRRMPTRADLDAVSTDVPIIAVRACGHILAANSRALALGGVDVADGILRENEQSAVWRHIPQPSNADMLDAMISAQHGLYAKGITSIHSDDFTGNDTGEFLSLLRDAGDSGRLKVRYAVQANVGEPAALESFFAQGLHTIRGSRMRVSCIKLLADGSLGARTAALQGEYADAPGNRGIAIYSQETLSELVRIAARHQTPTAIHAIGDLAMEQALCAIETEGEGLSHAIVHAQISTAAQVARCGRLGLTIMAQPIFLDADAPIVRARVGTALAETSYRWRSMLCAGANVAFSTDCPVEPYDPFANLYCAITRRGLRGTEAYLPTEAFTLDEALYAYTVAGARASGEGNEKGALSPGMPADFIVLNALLDENEPASVRNAGVAQTYIGGEQVFAQK